MQKEGANLLYHYSKLAFMGFVEVLLNLRAISKNFALCKKQILDSNPDAIILIDYAGFNLRIAKFAKKYGIPVYFYISPKVWAWKKSRIKTIKKYVDKLFVIFPFEVDFFAKHDYKVYYVGNPLMDALDDRRSKFTTKEQFIAENKLGDKPIISILPGSRKQELLKSLPVMLKTVSHFKNYRFVVAATSALDKSLYEQIIGDVDVDIVFDKTYELLNISHSAIVTSGTATLETALFNVPQVVCYKANAITYLIARYFVNIEFISLVNILSQKKVVTELIQNDFNDKLLVEELDSILSGKKRDVILQNYSKLYSEMGQCGVSKRLVQYITEDE